METFKKRSIEVLFTLLSGTGSARPKQYSFAGLRISARIQYMPGAYSVADIQVYGLSQDFMRQLLCFNGYAWDKGATVDNRIELRYIDETNVTVFEGGIIDAIVDYNTAPEVPLCIHASATSISQLKTPPALSFKGSVAVETIIRTIVSKYIPGQTVDNHGVTAVLKDESVNGSALDMITQVCEHANIRFWQQNNTVIIAPKNGGRIDPDPIELSMENGLVGWPVMTNKGVMAQAIFSPEYVAMRTVRLACPALFDGKRSFFIEGVTHEVDSEIPDGKWFSQLSLALQASNS